MPICSCSTSLHRIWTSLTRSRRSTFWRALPVTVGKAVVMVLHDLHLALRYADHAIALGNGRAVGGAAEAILATDRLSALFGHQLIALGNGTARTFLPA